MIRVPDIIASREIVGLRIRLGAFGKLVLQEQRRLVKLPSWPRTGEPEEYAGKSVWKDVDGKDASRITEVTNLLNRLSAQTCGDLVTRLKEQLCQNTATVTMSNSEASELVRQLELINTAKGCATSMSKT